MCSVTKEAYAIVLVTDTLVTDTVTDTVWGLPFLIVSKTLKGKGKICIWFKWPIRRI